MTHGDQERGTGSIDDLFSDRVEPMLVPAVSAGGIDPLVAPVRVRPGNRHAGWGGLLALVMLAGVASLLVGGPAARSQVRSVREGPESPDGQPVSVAGQPVSSATTGESTARGRSAPRSAAAATPGQAPGTASTTPGPAGSTPSSPTAGPAPTAPPRQPPVNGGTRPRQPEPPPISVAGPAPALPVDPPSEGTEAEAD